MCAVDISKAFDCINHPVLLAQITSSDLHSNLVRWLAAYLRGRTASCVYGSKKSTSMILQTGVPLGSVLLLALFNFFVSDCPNLADVLSSYADDFTTLESDSDLNAFSRKLQNSLTPIVEWASRKKLTIALNKSQVTLFTPWNRQFNVRPDITIDGVEVPICRTPKILRVTFDTMFSFKDHVAAIAAKAMQRLNILKAVCSSAWGHDKETLLITYEALIDSVFSYAAAVWFPNCKPSNVEKLQFIQNSAMRLVTGCHKASSNSSIDHLLTETKMMRVSEYLSMLCAQYLFLL
jgi:hypothetical protein